jgi:hypothetical protein
VTGFSRDAKIEKMRLLQRRSLLLGFIPLAAGGQKLEREVGITTSSLTGHVSVKPGAAPIALLDLPRFISQELDMRVIDFNTRTIEGAATRELETLRKNAVDNKCVLTNLKLNHPDLMLDSPGAAARAHAISTYKASIDQAALLGCRWVRVLPQKRRPDWQRYVAGLREVAIYAESKKMRLLVENYGWMENDANAGVNLIRDVQSNTAAQPDTGNWSDDTVRYEGLAKMFPLAVSCDFKAMELGPGGEHKAYDLHRCFLTGWRAGFRGPWCIEYLNKDYAAEMRGLRAVRDMLRQFMQRVTV